MHHPCPGCIPTVPSPGLHPGLVCVDPLGQMECGRAHPYAPSVSRMHPHRPCPGCITTVRVPDAYPPSHPQGYTLAWYALTLWVKWTAAERIHPHRPFPRVAPTIPVPDAYPPSISQGYTLGWYALTLWVKWNAALLQRASRTKRRHDALMRLERVVRWGEGADSVQRLKWVAGAGRTANSVDACGSNVRGDDAYVLVPRRGKCLKWK